MAEAVTAPHPRRSGLPRDVTFCLDTLQRIHATAAWLEAHLPDLHDLAYSPSSGSDDPHIQTSDQRDLSTQIGRPAQAAWHTTVRSLKAALLELERGEYSTTQTFTAGTLPDPERPGRDTTMPKRVAQQVHQAAARRKQRGEWTPQPLTEQA